MHGLELLHSLFKKTLDFMHERRLRVLLDAVLALLVGKELSLTFLGRHLESTIKERSCIRKMDRLLGNKHLQGELSYCYQSLCSLLINKISQPVISVDWACVNKKKDWHILRASLNVEGRGLVLYQEVHPYQRLNSTKIQSQFLDKLKKLLPPDCKPIVIADAGFRFPWFKKIKRIEFDFVGRVRNKTGYGRKEKQAWQENCLELYKLATGTPKHLGRYFFTKKEAFACEAVLVKKKKKQRKHVNRSGKPTNNTVSNRCARCQRAPWLLVTSLDVKKLGAKKVVSLYAKRMQIEEDFRDIKSHQFGFGLRYCMSNQAKRIEVLLLIAALACLACWLMALSAKENNLHRDFQSNSMRERNVLSIIYLGCQLVRRKIIFSFEALKSAYFKLQNAIAEAVLC